MLNVADSQLDQAPRKSWLGARLHSLANGERFLMDARNQAWPASPLPTLSNALLLGLHLALSSRCIFNQPFA